MSLKLLIVWTMKNYFISCTVQESPNILQGFWLFGMLIRQFNIYLDKPEQNMNKFCFWLNDIRQRQSYHNNAEATSVTKITTYGKSACLPSTHQLGASWWIAFACSVSETLPSLREYYLNKKQHKVNSRYKDFFFSYHTLTFKGHVQRDEGFY